jgi:hypothetical protein
MIIPWKDINVTKRFIVVNKKVITKFPVFFELLKDYQDELKKDRSQYNISLLDNVLKNSFDDNTEVYFYFESSGNYISQHIDFSITILNNKPVGEFYKDIFKSNVCEVKEKYNQDLFKFFKKLNSKIKGLYCPLNNRIYEIIISSKIRDFLKGLPEEVKRFIDADNLYRFVPEIEFIVETKIGISYGEPLFDMFDYFKDDIIHQIEWRINEEKKEIFKQQAEEIFKEIKDNINELLSKLKQKYIIKIENL